MSPWWTYDSLLWIMIRYEHFWKHRSYWLPLSFCLSVSPLMTREKLGVVIWCPRLVDDTSGLCYSDIAFSTAYWYGNALYVHAHIYIFSFQRRNNKCMRQAQHLENRSLLLNVDSATLPPSGAQTQCRQAVFHYHHLQGVDFLPQRSRDMDWLHICSLGSVFYRHFYSMLKNMPCI